MPPLIFISYSSRDKPVADAVCTALERAGLRCWIAPRDIAPGDSWGKAIIDAISAAQALLLIFSGHANASPQIEREVERAVAKGVPVIPLRIEQVLPSGSLEYFLGTPHWLDALPPPVERHLDRIVAAIRQATSPAAVGAWDETVVAPIRGAVSAPPTRRSPAPAPPERPSAPAPALSPALLQAAQTALTQYLGPIAKLLVRQAAERSSSAADLSERLAANLPKPEQATAFRRKLAQDIQRLGAS